MGRESSRKRLRTLLFCMILIASLMLVAPVSQPRASLSCNPPEGGFCIEFTVFNPETCQCECPDQACCDYYAPFVPNGCDGKRMIGKRATANTLADKQSEIMLLPTNAK
jgi:hypothetical protein